MFSLIATTALLFASSHAQDNTKPYGTNPIGGFSVEFLGNQTSDNSCSLRDLGFMGQIQGNWYAVYGDTLWCAQGVTNPENEPSGFHGMVRSSVSAATDSALIVHDLNLNSNSPVPHQNQFIYYNSSWGETVSTGFGGTSIVGIADDSPWGGVFYLVNENKNGLKGAGICAVQVIDGTPTCIQRSDTGNTGYWWPTDDYARYGDVAAYADVNSEYIYAIGGVPNSVTSWPDTEYVYQLRVPADQLYVLDAYEYWWGRETGWSKEILTSFNETTAVMWGVGGGQIVWSEYFKVYIFAHLEDNTVKLRTASSPEGPWSADVTVYTPTLYDHYAYAGAIHPYVDSSGQTLTISYTNQPNVIQVIKVTFD